MVFFHCIFKSYIIDIEKKLILLSQEIKNASKNATNVTIESGTKTESYSRVTNRFTNFLNRSWGKESGSRRTAVKAHSHRRDLPFQQE